MEKLANYTIVAQIAETRKSIVYRGEREDDHKPVILKVLKTHSPTPAEVARFKQAYAMVQKLDLDGVIKIYAFVEGSHGYAIVEENFAGYPLTRLIAGEPLELRCFLQIAIQLAETLGQLHKQNISHLDIKPGNVLINHTTGQVKLTDFGIIAELTHENDEIYHPDVIQGTLSYMSPEQTGRVNRETDYRADIYALGILFFEMLTGELPFRSSDPMEMIHAHIALEPKPPNHVNTAVPNVLSKIILKMMAKAPEERYQNCFGLAVDLQTCLELLTENNQIEAFPIAKRDLAQKFIVPPILVGREEESQKLMDSFKRVTNGATELMLVSGRPGIGKSALINEIHKPVVAKNGYFISGKYDKFKKNTPYSAISQAFIGLIKHILVESEERLSLWRHALKDALGTNGKILTDVIPELRLLIGEQDEVPELSPEKSRSRFKMVFRNFLHVFTVKTPLVLFLDDLQWADSASIDLIKAIITDPDMRHFLLITAYRDNEFDDSHPFMRMKGELKKQHIPVNEIFLSPLSRDDINNLLSYVLCCEKETSMLLSEVISSKTGGNPFFMIQFTKTLYDGGYLQLDPEQGWQWDQIEIDFMQVTEDVVELLADKIAKLDNRTQNILKVCATIGNRFDLATIATVASMTIEETLRDLTTAINENLIGRHDDLYRFNHDRIQEAAYVLISERYRSIMHYAVGKNILDKTGATEVMDNIFYITDQLNLGCEMISDPAEILRLSELNLMAGEKAWKSSAYLSAVKYLKNATALLPDDAWALHYDLAYTIHAKLIETEYMNQNFEEAAHIFETAVQHVKSTPDRTKLYELMVVLLTSAGKYKEAFGLGREGLALLGERLPEKGHPLLLPKELVKLWIAFGRRDIETLIDLPCCEDTDILAKQCLMLHTSTVVYYLEPTVFPVMPVRGLRMVLKHGHFPYSCHVIATVASILSGGIGLIDVGYRLGKIALKLALQSRNPFDWGRVKFLYAMMVLHTRQHAKESCGYFRQAYQHGLEAGDMIFSAHSVNLLGMYRILIGDNLEDILEEYTTYETFQKNNKDPFAVQNYNENIQMCLCLMGRTAYAGILNDAGFDEKEHEKKYIEDKNLLGQFYFGLLRLKVNYLFGHIDACIDVLPLMDDLVEKKVAIGSLHIPEFHFYAALTLAAAFAGADSKLRKHYIMRLKEHVAKMEKWARFCPHNFEHKMFLMEAEVARIKRRAGDAAVFYDKAISSAHDHGYLQNEGIANELAAIFKLSQSDKDSAKAYLTQAHHCFFRWGALAKTMQLEKAYPELLTGAILQSQQNYVVTPQISPMPSAAQAPFNVTMPSSDLSEMLKTAQELSSETGLDRVLTKIVQLSIETSDAQTCYLLLADEETHKLYIQAAGGVNREITVLQSVAVENNPDLPASIIEWVTASKEDLVLNNAAVDNRFMRDPYITHYQIKSVLCLPIRYKGSISGILYLENNLATGVFTQDSAALMRILGYQAAISIINARLITNRENAARLANEMQIEAKVQTALLPLDVSIPGYEIATHIKPADEAGEDYYDVINIGDISFIVIGDASGHNVPAGLVNIMAHTAIQAVLVESPKIPIVELLVKVNAVMADNFKRLGEDSIMRVTLCALHDDGRFIFSGPEQEVLIHRKATGTVERIGTKRVGAGLADHGNDSRHDDRIQIEPGDTMLLYPNKIIEAWKTNPLDEPNAAKRDHQPLVDVFGRLAGGSSASVKDGIMDVLVKEYNFSDDATMVVLKREQRV